MANEYVHNPQDPIEERYARLEEKFIVIFHNMDLLIVVVPSKLGLFKEYGSFNSKIESKGELGDHGDQEKESRKDTKKEKLITKFQYHYPLMFLI